MKYAFYIIIVLFYNSKILSQNTNYLKKTIHVLCSAEMEGRGVDSKGINLAQNFIVKQYGDCGLLKYNSNSYFQSFECKDRLGKVFITKNIIGFINNHVDSTIVFCAHYDHIDVCSNLSRELTTKLKCNIHAGANDNASGVSLILSLAKSCIKFKKPTYNFLFVALSAHEIGLYGSNYLFESDYFKKLKVKALLNFDMVGGLNTVSKELTVGLSDTESGKYFSKIIHLVNDTSKLIIFKHNAQLLQSDATIFNKNNIPTLSFTTGITEDYHKITDTEEKINYKGMIEIHKLMIAFITNI
jgi:hypothetical protein